jgi:hypothetical protein
MVGADLVKNGFRGLGLPADACKNAEQIIEMLDIKEDVL